MINLQLGGMGMKNPLAPSGDGTSEDEPLHKKQKTEESLIPESQFLAQNKVK